LAISLSYITPHASYITQSRCFIGLRDTVTPLVIYAAGGVCTLVLNVVLCTDVAGTNLGLRGCALAVTVGQWAVAAAFVHTLHRRDLLELVRPDWRLVRELFSNVGVLVLGTLARMGTYTVMTAAATSMGVVSGAAHKVAYECYFLLSFCTEPMFTAANALMPRFLVRAPTKAAKLALVLLSTAATVGVALLCVATLATTHPVFTQDPAVLDLLVHIR
jgi:Na+-driven multidrug efflux pump